jgi:abortive infection bacteriophage resistance protein
MSILYPKQYQTPERLAQLLANRGLVISNEEEVAHHLKSIGYYRFSAYLYPLISFPKENQQFKPQSEFSTALALYRFDNGLRQFLYNQIGGVEVAVRSAMANIITAETGDMFWMTDSRNFINQLQFEKTLAIIQHELEISKEEFIHHFRSKYSNPYPPAWMLVEILPMGTLNYIYNNLYDSRLKKKVAAHFSLTVPVFSSWFTIVILTRNACCHYARVWNKENAVAPVLPKKLPRPWIDPSIPRMRIFYNICILKWFVDVIEPENSLREQLEALLAKYPMVDTRAMGFPDDWRDEPLWK